MKKFSVFVILLASFSLNAQLPKWILGGSEQNAGGSFHPYGPGNLVFYEVNFNGTLSSTLRTIGTSIQNIKSLGTQDVVQTAVDTTTNTVLFYAFIAAVGPYNGGFPAIQPDTVYFAAYNTATAADEIIGKAPTTGWGASVLESELVKKPGSSTEYYFIYKTQSLSLSLDNIMYVTIDAAAQTVSAPNYIVSSTHNGEGMAVSKLNCMNQRWLFVTRPESNGNITLRRCAITNSGISAPVDIYTISIPGNSTSVVAGVEIAPTNNYLAVANFNNTPVSKNMILFDYNNSTGTVSNERSYTNQSTYDFVTMEFSPNASRVYILQGGEGTFPNVIYNCPVVSTNYTVTSANQMSGITLNESLTLELAYDGNIYVNPGQSDDFMYIINNPNSAATTVTTTAPGFFGTNQLFGSAFPDQVDGDRNPIHGVVNVSVTPTATTICPGQTTTLIAAGGANYQWSGGSIATTSSISVTPSVTTTYSVATTGNCIGSASATVNVIAFSPSRFTYTGNTCSSPNTDFFSQANTGNVVWFFGDGSTSTAINATHIYQSPGTYQITLIANPNTACADTSKQNIIVANSSQNQIMPNIFTPNGDGINDELTFSGLGNCTEYTLEIYNRWGLKVFETDEPQAVFWKGTLNTTHDISDEYYYYLLTPKNNAVATLKGTVLVIR
jgi:gliding motility-associated-like protein